MLSKTIIVATIIGSLCIGGAIAAGIVISQKQHTDVYYKDPATFDPSSSVSVDNITSIQQINVNTQGITVANSYLPSIPDMVDNTTSTNVTRVPLWWDEFSGSSLDTSSWLVIDGPGETGWGNRELQTYRSDNVVVDSDMMHISAMRDSNGDWTSGRVHSKGSWTPGMVVEGKTVSKIYFESLIIIPPSGNGLWPAFWAFPQDSVYGNYAASGEIDMMELRDSYDKVTSGIHYGGEKPDNLRNMTRTFSSDGETFANKMFVFGCEWTLDTIVLTINGMEVTRRVSTALDPENGWFSSASNAKVSSPFDEPFHSIFNIAVGGNFPQYEPDETTPNVATMSIDYFRVFADFA